MFGFSSARQETRGKSEHFMTILLLLLLLYSINKFVEFKLIIKLTKHSERKYFMYKITTSMEKI